MNTMHSKRRSTSTLLVTFAAAVMLAPLSASAYDRSGDKSGDKYADKTATERLKDMTEGVSDTASDVRMHLAIETSFARSDELSALSINTDVKDGAVHLEGEVETDAQKELAAELAKSVEGVKSVRNDLEVKQGDPSLAERVSQGASDMALTARVKTRLLASDNTSGLAIKVSTDDSVVILEGEVESDTERELAEMIAANTSGVEEVENKLRVAKAY
jgi:hyperosmotically inducible periplasmic protein